VIPLGKKPTAGAVVTPGGAVGGRDLVGAITAGVTTTGVTDCAYDLLLCCSVDAGLDVAVCDDRSVGGVPFADSCSLEAVLVEVVGVPQVLDVGTLDDVAHSDVGDRVLSDGWGLISLESLG